MNLRERFESKVSPEPTSGCRYCKACKRMKAMEYYRRVGGARRRHRRA